LVLGYDFELVHMYPGTTQTEYTTNLAQPTSAIARSHTIPQLSGLLTSTPTLMHICLFPLILCVLIGLRVNPIRTG